MPGLPRARRMRPRAHDPPPRSRTPPHRGRRAAANRWRDDREWDTDRAVELEAAITGLAGLALGAAVRSGFLLMPAVVGAAVVTHAVTGWHPLLPLLRRLGLRTSREIERERYALKALRGDFDGMTGKEVRHASR